MKTATAVFMLFVCAIISSSEVLMKTATAVFILYVCDDVGSSAVLMKTATAVFILYVCDDVGSSAVPMKNAFVFSMPLGANLNLFMFVFLCDEMLPDGEICPLAVKDSPELRIPGTIGIREPLHTYIHTQDVFCR